MGLISFQCQQCSAEIKTDDSLCGEEVKCPSCGNTSKIPIPGVYPGLDLDGFIIEKLLGTGGMGEVWLARQQNLNRHVALKILSPKYTHNPAFIDRFMNEVRNTAKFEHPNIVTAFHAGVANGIYYMAISYVSGITVFDKLCETGTLSEKESLQIARAVAEALDYAWNEFKILHRDIKPSNIMIDKKGVPKLMDMGISKSIDEQSSLTMTGMMIGTPYYVSPEQAIGAKDIDFRADIYSLGATLYHMVTGNVPYDATTAMAIVSKHLSEPLPDPRNFNAALSDQIVALIKIMMAKDKNDRQKSWRAVIEDINRVLDGQYPITPIPDANKTAVEARQNIYTPPVDNTIAETPEQTKTVPGAKEVSVSIAEKSTRNKYVFLLILALIVILCIATVLFGAFFVYKHYKSKSGFATDKRKDPLPTEIIAKPKEKTAPSQTPEINTQIKTIDESEKKIEQILATPIVEKNTEANQPESDAEKSSKLSDKTLTIEEKNEDKQAEERPRPKW